MTNIGINIGLFVALFAALIVCLEAGRRSGRKAFGADRPHPAGLGTVEAVTFGLLGLLIAFTFSGFSSSVRNRVHAVGNVHQAIVPVGKIRHLVGEDCRSPGAFLWRPAECGRNRGLVAGTGHATSAIAVSILRRRLSAAALVVTMLVAAGGSVLANASHPICVAKQHDCGRTAKVSSCCCGDQGTRDDATPAQSRVELAIHSTVVPALADVIGLLSEPSALPLVQSSPPGLCLLDLPTLFVTFLI